MALDRDQVGLLFKVNADTADAVQAFSLLRGVVEGMAAETSEQLQRMASRFGAVGDQVRKTGQQFRESFGDAARGQLAGYVSQFGLFGDAAAGMIPSLTGSAAAIAGLTGVTVAAGAALAGTAMHAMDYTGKIDDLAQMTNLTTETIQSLRLAATLSGQSFEDVSQSAIIFQKRIEEAKNGNADLMATFKALGVDLNGPVDQAFRRTLESFNQFENGSAKTAAGLEIFGKGASKLFGVMNQVGGSFDNLVTRARELGLVLDQEAIAKSNELADRLDILKLRLDAIVLDIGVGVIDFFTKLPVAIGDTSTAVKNLITDIDKLPGRLLRLTKETMTGLSQGGIVGAAARASMVLGEIGGVGAGAYGATAPEGFQGPDIDPATGLPTRTFKTTAKPAGGGAAKAEKLVSLPSGDAITRAYEQYRQMIANEEKATAAQREKLRIDAIQGEEAKLRDALMRQDEAIAKARADAAAGARTSRADVLQQVVANLEAEKALTMQAIEEIETARVQAMMRFVEAANAQTADRLANELEAEQEYLDNWAQAYEDALARIDEQIRASSARRRAEQEADPSSPLNIFGPAGQDAADKGAGIFGQMGASASDALGKVSDQIGSFGTMMQDVFSGIASGLQNVIQGFIMTGKLGGAAFKQMAAQIVSSLVAQSAVKAIFELAEGFAMLAQAPFDPTGKAAASAAGHFAAAKMYGVVAGVAAAAAVGMSAIGPGGGGSGGQFLAQDRGGGGTMIREQGGRRSSEPQVIIIRAETEPGVMVSKFVQDYRANGEARSVLRRDLLGEF